ncbi:BA75_03388T0 [Komagataella pastoris]|uniref:BA75_03388T0 n=1 Tax=Komagataella pastoris TaxID=4922 RepID=A0A1B2JGQ6_PICPA|nr:BA75_03388T0 [Komagataella pastoris]
MIAQSVELGGSKQSQNKHKWIHSQDVCLLEIVYSMLPDILSTCRNPYKSWSAALNVFNQKSNVKFKQGRTLKERFKALQRSYAALFAAKSLTGTPDIFFEGLRTTDHGVRPMDSELRGMMQKINKSLKHINNLNTAVIDQTKRLRDEQDTTSSNMPYTAHNLSRSYSNSTALQNTCGEPPIAKRRLVDYIDHIDGELLRKDAATVPSAVSGPTSRISGSGQAETHLSEYPDSNEASYPQNSSKAATPQPKKTESAVTKFTESVYMEAGILSQLTQLQEQIKFLETKIVCLDQTLNSKVDLILRYLGQHSGAQKNVE